jgi:hypothetical protein
MKLQHFPPKPMSAAKSEGGLGRQMLEERAKLGYRAVKNHPPKRYGCRLHACRDKSGSAAFFSIRCKKPDARP